jgi:hypothetical protein
MTVLKINSIIVQVNWTPVDFVWRLEIFYDQRKQMNYKNNLLNTDIVLKSHSKCQSYAKRVVYNNTHT